MTNMMSLRSFLALNSILALAGNVIAAPLPDSYEPAHKTMTVWRTYIHTKVVGVTKTEWTYPPTADPEAVSSTGYYSEYPTDPAVEDIPAPTTTPCTTTAPSSDDTDPNVVYMTLSTTIDPVDMKIPLPSDPPASEDPHVVTPPVYSSTPVYTPPPVVTPKVDPEPMSSSKEDSYPEPTPTPQKEETPEPKQTPKKETPEPQPVSTVSDTPADGWDGDATYYAPGMGSCGIESTNDQYIVALWSGIMSAHNPGNPNANDLCGKSITCTRGSKSVTVTVVDSCPGCAYGGMDFSEAAFKKLGTLDEGRFKIHCNWAGAY